MSSSVIFDRYLSILGVEAEPPGLDFLTRLVTAQLTRVPFENISKLYLRQTIGASFIPSLEEHLDGIEHSNFGGTCYANNPYFYDLLRFLGYDVTLCGADMANPDVHVVITVDLEGRQWLVDVGYGAPFFRPLPRDLESEHEIRFGSCRYVLVPQDDHGQSRLKMYRDDEHIHGYLAKPEPREIGHFREIIDESYRNTASFMNSVVVECFSSGRSVRFHNFTMTESTADTATSTQLDDCDSLVEALELHCGISADTIRIAIRGISLEADIYS